MNNGIKGKEQEDKFFTAEFFGVTVIITAFLLLLCLFFGEKVLFEIGKEVQCFILGALGYFAYPFLLTLFLVGFLVLLGKKPNRKRVGSLIFLTFLVFIVFSVMTILDNDPKPTELSKYINFAFESGRLGTSGVVAGGALFSLITFYPVKVLGNIFTIIILSVVTIFAIYFRLKYKKKHKNDPAQNQTQEVGQVQQPQTAQPVQPQVQPNQQFASQYPQQPNYGYNQPSPYGQDSNVYGAPINGGYPNIFGGQPLNYGGQPYPNQQQPYPNQQQGYNQPNGYNQPSPDYSQNPNAMNREDAMRILYGNNNGMPKTYSTGFNDSFSGLGYKRTDNGANPQQYGGGGGSVSGEIPKTNLFDSYTYEDRTNEINDTPNDFSNFNNPTDDYDDDEDTQKAREFFSKIKEQYTSNEPEEETNDYTQNTSTNYDYKDDYDNNVEETFEEDIVEETFEEVEEPKFEEPIVETQQTDNGLSEYGKKLMENMPKNYRYKAPPITLLKQSEKVDNDYEYEIFKAEISNKILETLDNFGVKTNIARVLRGPTISRFDIEVPKQISMEAITKRYKDINLRIAAKTPIRMVAPVPGTSYVGIEVANRSKEFVMLRDLVSSSNFRDTNNDALTFALGKDVVGAPICLDVTQMPHLLIAGATKSGKSVCLNTLIVSLLMKYSPEELRIIIIDPKKVEFKFYENLPHLYFGTIVNNGDIALTTATLNWVYEEMSRRYSVFTNYKVRNLDAYNKKARENGEKIMPKILLVIDEFASIMLKDKNGANERICALVAEARAAGIHLILATQRPSVDIMDGPIKANLPARIVFKVASDTDSRVCIGKNGAETLLGSGDGLYKTDGMFDYDRFMGAYVSDDEIADIVDYVKDNNDCYFDYNSWSRILANVSASQPQEPTENLGGGGAVQPNANAMDPLAVNAMRMGYDYGGLSISAVQTKLAIGYPRAARIVNWLVDNGYVTPNSIAGKKQMILPKEEFEEKFGNNG